MKKEEISAAKRHIVEACIQAAKSRGYSDATGVLRGTLLLADEPVSMDDLVDSTGYSKSTVSSSMNLLEGLGIAKRIVTPGDKRYRYVPETDPDVMRSVMLSGVRKEVQWILAALDLTEREIRLCDDTGEVLAGLERIRRFYKQIDELLDLLSRYTTEELIELLRSKMEP